jgi:hypothetical protein
MNEHEEAARAFVSAHEASDEVDVVTSLAALLADVAAKAHVTLLKRIIGMARETVTRQISVEWLEYHRRELEHVREVPAPPAPVDGGTLTVGQLREALRNIDYDLTCGGCASRFYTGHKEPCDATCETKTSPPAIVGTWLPLTGSLTTPATAPRGR